LRQGSGIRDQGLVKAGAMAALAATALLAGCRQDMQDQPKFYPQRGTTFYADGRSVRPQVENTVARGQLHEDSYFYTGMTGNAEGATMPFPVTMDVLKRGQERFNIYCSACHSRVGNGVGMIVERGYAKAGNFHTARLQNAPLGHFFSVITNGYGAMPDYAQQLTPADRWAVVAYIKALQLSQNATQADVPSGEHVQPLADIATDQGFTAGFVSEWTLPPTAVTGTPDGGLYIIPPVDLATPAGTSQTPKEPANSRGTPLPPPSGQSSTGYPNQAVPPGPPQ
jgi:cytochrome c553